MLTTAIYDYFAESIEEISIRDFEVEMADKPMRISGFAIAPLS